MDNQDNIKSPDEMIQEQSKPSKSQVTQEMLEAMLNKAEVEVDNLPESKVEPAIVQDTKPELPQVKSDIIISKPKEQVTTQRPTSEEMEDYLEMKEEDHRVTQDTSDNKSKEDNSDEEEVDPVLTPWKELNQDQKDLLEYTLSSMPKGSVSYAKVNLTSNPYTYQDLEKWRKDIQLKGDGDIPLPGVSQAEYYQRAASRSNFEYFMTPEGQDFGHKLANSFRLVPSGGVFDSVLRDGNREFYQELDYETATLKPTRPTFTSKSNVLPQGKVAATRFKAMRGKGDILQIPLWHSGFWVTLRAPGDTRLIDLEQDVLRAKVALGRMLGGVLFANDQVHLADKVMELVKECLYQTSLIDSDLDTLFDKIKLPDLPILAWGLACVIWPNGYHFHRAVLSLNGFTDKVVQGKVDISKLLWVDRKSLSEKQLKHMVRKNKPMMSNESLVDYTNNFVKNHEKRVKIDDNTTIVIGTPSISEHLDAGFKWIENVNQAVEAVLTDESDDEKRNQLMNKYAKANILGQYRHYIKSIIFYNEESNTEEVYDKAETIDSMVEDLSEEREATQTITKAVKEFIDESVVAIIASPSVTEEEDKIADKKFPGLVPLDPIFTFFSLAIQRVERIDQQQLTM